MANMTPYLQNALLGHTLLGSVFTLPTTKYLSLGTSAASDGLSFEEVPSGTAYARQIIAFGSPTDNKISASTNTVNFPTATTPWGGITHLSVCDSVSGGNRLYWGAATATKTIDTGDTYQLPIGNGTIELQ